MHQVPVKHCLAKAVAGEAGVAFFSISGSDFVEMFVGVGASRVRDLFEQAKKHSPCIIFIDEIDAVGRQRGAGMGGGHDEREQTLNQLLVEMDGFDSTTGIIILAATNRPDILDKALLRPGRFDRQVVIDRPEIRGREEILKVHIKGKPLAKDVSLWRLAKATPGFTGADLENMVNEGALSAARQKKEIIDMIDLENAIDKVSLGAEKKSKVIKEKDKEITAYHEIGHALLQIIKPSQYKFHKVSIIPRGMALGVSWTAPEDDIYHVSKQEYLNSIAAGLAGRAAEMLIFNKTWSGATSDIDNVTQTARRMVTEFGMSEKLGPIKYGQHNDHVFMGRDFGSERDYSDAIAADIDAEVKRIIDEQHEVAYNTLRDNRDMMDTLVRELLERETLSNVEVYKIMDKVLVERGEEPKYALNLDEEDLEAGEIPGKEDELVPVGGPAETDVNTEDSKPELAADTDTSKQET